MIYKKILIITFSLILIQTVISSATMNNTQGNIGITKIYKNDPEGRDWVSKWDNGIARSWSHQQNDPYDREFLTADMGKGSLSVDGAGTLKAGRENSVTDSILRMYVYNQTNASKEWHNVEITVYGRRVSDNCGSVGSCSWTGIEAYARTNHIIDDNSCDDRGYGGRITSDGNAGFEKVIHHKQGEEWSNTVPIWGGNPMPYNQWIGLKFIVYDLPTFASNRLQKVKLELWADRFEDGNWTKVNEVIDDGTGSVFSHPDACHVGVDPNLQLTASDTRSGSETGHPNRAVFFRDDDANTNGIWYKNASIREIVPVQDNDTKFIKGIVIDSLNRTGISGVTISANTSISTTTNATGFYSFEVTEGTFNLTATFDITFFTNTTTVSTEVKAITWQDIELVKKPTGTITGSVASKILII
jgi:hypothetical protein